MCQIVLYLVHCEAGPAPTPTPEVRRGDENIVELGVEEEDSATTITTEDEEGVKRERKQLLVRIPTILDEDDD